MSKSISEIANSSPPDDFLFAADLTEKIKLAKQLEKAGKDLRPITFQPPPQSLRKGKRGGAAPSRPYQTRPGYYSGGNLNRRRLTYPPREIKSRKALPSRNDRKFSNYRNK
ncbi:hypothetical protein PPYR_10880 [Photinus pyralis]|uniref:Uncharacterized protein n=1 Tax=Photinus pyralis TaxID=7054 RepID=A0A5N4AHP8_PHOPY|nr:hypothetical protein PPYR_10880 [Photinus pyralis]